MRTICPSQGPKGIEVRWKYDGVCVVFGEGEGDGVRQILVKRGEGKGGRDYRDIKKWWWFDGDSVGGIDGANIGEGPSGGEGEGIQGRNNDAERRIVEVNGALDHATTSALSS
jgi:hypothetical protein